MMHMRQVPVPPWEALRPDVYAAMGYGTLQPEEALCITIQTVCEDILSQAAPCIMYDVREASLQQHGQLRVGHVVFSPGGIIRSYLTGTTHVCLFVATAGESVHRALRRYREQGNLLSEFIADSLGSVLAEQCVHQLGHWLSADYPWPHSMPYSPGYCGWNIVEQQLLFSLFPDRPCGVSLSDSCLMWPVKSVSGIVALGAELVPQPYRCDICTNSHCYKRRT